MTLCLSLRLSPKDSCGSKETRRATILWSPFVFNNTDTEAAHSIIRNGI